MTQEDDDTARKAGLGETGAMSALAGLEDRETFVAALGAVRGALAELEADGHQLPLLADASVMAASQKIREHFRPSTWLAWCERQRATLDAIIEDADARGAELAEAAWARRVN